MEDRSIGMLSHWVGIYNTQAVFALEKGNAERERQELLEKLRGLDKHPAVSSCIRYLTKTSWRTGADLDKFRKHYQSVEPTTHQVDDNLAERLRKR